MGLVTHREGHFPPKIIFFFFFAASFMSEENNLQVADCFNSIIHRKTPKIDIILIIRLVNQKNLFFEFCMRYSVKSHSSFIISFMSFLIIMIKQHTILCVFFSTFWTSNIYSHIKFSYILLLENILNFFLFMLNSTNVFLISA